MPCGCMTFAVKLLYPDQRRKCLPRVCLFSQVHRVTRSQLGTQGLHHSHQGASLAFLIIQIFLISFKTRKSEMVVKYDREQEDVVTFPRHTHKVVILHSKSWDSRFCKVETIHDESFTLSGGHLKAPPGV